MNIDKYLISENRNKNDINILNKISKNFSFKLDDMDWIEVLDKRGDTISSFKNFEEIIRLAMGNDRR